MLENLMSDFERIDLASSPKIDPKTFTEFGVEYVKELLEKISEEFGNEKN